MAVNLIRLKNLRDNIELLNENEQLEVIKIILKNECVYTINKNGFFLNLNLVGEEILEQLEEYLNYSYKNNIVIEKLMTEREEKLNLNMT